MTAPGTPGTTKIGVGGTKALSGERFLGVAIAGVVVLGALLVVPAGSVGAPAPDPRSVVSLAATTDAAPTDVPAGASHQLMPDHVGLSAHGPLRPRALPSSVDVGSVLAHGSAPPLSARCGFASSSTTCDSPLGSAAPRPASAVDEWLNLTGTTRGSPVPSARWFGSMSFDDADGYSVYFGGCAAARCPLNETWVFSWGAWLNITNSSDAPPARYGAAMWYDASSSVVWLYGGCGAICPLADTWYFAGGRWVNWTANATSAGASPPAVWDAAATYWGTGGGGVVVGGCTDAGCLQTSNATYVLLSGCGCWLPFGTAGGSGSAPSVAGAGLAYDPYAASLVLYGGLVGCSTHCVDTNATWVLFGSNQTWTNVTAYSEAQSGSNYPAAPRSNMVLEYDAVDGYVLLFGGIDDANQVGYSDTYFEGELVWSGTTGLPAHPRSTEYVAASSNSSYAEPVLFGGVNEQGPAGDTWLWDAGIQAVAVLGTGPSGGSIYVEPNATVVYNVTYAAGGTGPLFFLWSFGDGNGSTNRSGSHTYRAGPPLGSQLAVNCTVFDFSGASVIASVPSVYFGPPTIRLEPGSLWADAGLPISLALQSLSAGAFSVFHWSFGDGATTTTTGPSTEHAWSVPGTYLVEANATDSLGNPARAVSEVEVNSTPVVHSSSAPGEPEVGISVAFSAVAGAGTPPYAFDWQFGDGGTSDLPTPTHVYLAAGTYVTTVTLSDAFGAVTSDTGSVVVAALPTVRATASVSATDVGRPVVFHAETTGGVAPFTFAWSFGDGTNGTGNLTSHAYATPGTPVAEIVAKDAMGEEARANLTLLVAPLPTVTWDQSPLGAVVGEPVEFAGHVSGGTGELVVAWSFGDGGSASGPTVSHTFEAGGSFTVTAQVTDAVGGMSNTSATIAIAPPPSTPPAPVSPRLEVLVAGGLVLAAAISVGVWLLRHYRHRPSRREGHVHGPNDAGPPS